MTSPSTSPSRSTARELVPWATLAPSSHNTQPWRFRTGGDWIELVADRTRALPVNDPHDRELTISCGCALFNLRTAAAAAGRSTRIAVCPEAGNPDLLARLTLEGACAPDGLAGLHRLVEARRTCRRPFSTAAVDDGIVRALQGAAAEEGATLHQLGTPAQRFEAATLVAEGDARQWADPRWRSELAAWMHPRRRGDGLAVPALALPVTRLVVRTFDMGHATGAKDRALADGAPLLTVLSTAGDGVADWLAAGQALQRALLTGLQHGLQASYLNQPVQVPALRPRLRALCGQAGEPQLLLRWGVPGEVLPAAPRRPLAEVLELRAVGAARAADGAGRSSP